MPTKIKIRRATAANAATNNPTLLEGEPGLETDTRKLKIGDGLRAWSLLPYFEDEINPKQLNGQAGAYYLSRANHTGTQLAATISDLSGAFDGYLGAKYTDNLAEGAVNLYFTNARADARATSVINGLLGAANGITPLDGTGKIPTSYLPALAITDTFVVNSQAAMLAIACERGDVAVRTDVNKSFILQGNNPAVLADWVELLTPTDAVLSVNGQTGAVTLSTTHINEGANLYFTDSRALSAVGKDNLADGFDLTGGTTPRTLSVYGADVELNQSLTSTSSPTFARLNLNAATYAHAANTTVSGAVSLDLNFGVTQWTLGGNITISLTNPPSSGMRSGRLIIFQDAVTGGRTVAFTAGTIRGTVYINTAAGGVTIIGWDYFAIDGRLSITCNTDTATN